MSELSQATPDLDTRLQEIDRSLREIQAGLLPAGTPPGLPDEHVAEQRQPPEPGAPGPGAPEPGAPQPGLPEDRPRADRPPEHGQEPEPGPPEPVAPLAPEEPPEPGLEHPRRGRSGPLAALLQRSAGENPEPGDRPRPGDQLDPGDEPDARDEPMACAEPGRPPTDSIDQIVALTGLHVKLLEAYQLVLAQLHPAPAATDAPAAPQPAAPEHAAPEPSTVADVTLSVGPFRSTDAVRAFARALSGIPGVREVVVRGYDGENRAIVDVQLAEPTS